MLNEKSRHAFLIIRLPRLVSAFLLAMSFVAGVNAQPTPNITPLQKAIEKQRQRLNSGSEEERRDALMQLGAMRVPEASRASLPGLSDPVPMVRAVAASAVLALPADESVSVLVSLLSDQDEFVRREAAYALGNTKSRKATSPLISLLQTDKEESVKAAAVVALGEIGDEAAVIPLSGILAPELSGAARNKREKNVFVLRAAAEALGSIKSRAATPALIAALANEKLEPDIRREAARALGSIRDPSAIPALQSATTAADPYLASTAFDALKKISR